MTPPTPTRDTPAGQAYDDLRNLARRGGRDPAEYIILYALEGFLARLTRSEHAGEFVLKGGVLMAAFAARRPTRDIDFAATGFTNDITDVEQRLRRIIEVHLEDGLAFDSDSAVGEPIRDNADFSGVRVKITAQLATAKVALHVDVNFGDPIWPAPIEAVIPLLLGGTLRLAGYPDHMVLARRSSQRSKEANRTPAGVTSPTSQLSHGPGPSAAQTSGRRSIPSPDTARLILNRSDLLSQGCRRWRNASGKRGVKSNASNNRHR